MTVDARALAGGVVRTVTSGLRRRPLAVGSALVVLLGAGVVAWQVVLARDPANLVWTHTPAGGYSHTAGVHDGVVYVRNSGSSPLLGLDARTGGRRWTRPGFGFERLSEPLNGLVYREESRVKPGPEPGGFPVSWVQVSALEPATGALVWRGEEMHGDFLPGADTAYYITVEGDLVGVDARTGANRWRFTVGVSLPGAERNFRRRVTPAPGMALVFGVDGGLTAVDADTGRARWHLPDGGTRYSSVSVSPDAPDIVLAYDKARLTALDAATGQPLWLRTAPDHRWLRETCVTVTGRTAFLLYRHTLKALDAGTGGTRWTTPLPRPDSRDKAREYEPCVGPLVAGDTVYATPEHVVAVDAATGRRRWTFDADTVVPPVLIGGRLHLLARHNGKDVRIVALDARTGREAWHWQPQQNHRSGLGGGGRIHDGGAGMVVFTCFNCAKGTVFGLRA